MTRTLLPMTDTTMKLLEHFKELTLHPKNAQELKGLILQLAVQGKLTKNWRAENPNVEPASVLLEKIETEKAQLIKDKKLKKEKKLAEIMEQEIPYELPESWEWCRLGLLNKDIHYGYTASALSTFSGTRMLRITDIQNNTVNWERVPDCDIKQKDVPKYKLEEDDILIARTGGTIGKSYQVKKVNVSSVFASYLIRAIPLQAVFADYIKSWIESPFYWKQLGENSQGTGQPNVNATALKSLVISLPPLEEQKAIVSIVNQLFTEVEELEQQTKARIQLKEDFVTSALQQLANGDTAFEWEYLQTHFKTFFTERSAVKKLRESILQLAVQGKLTTHWRTNVRLSEVEVESASSLLERIKAVKDQLIKAGKIKKEKPLPEILEDEIPYELPEGWVWCRLEDLTSITGGVTKGKKNQTDLVNSAYLRVANVQRGFLNLDIMKEILISKGDFEKYQLKSNDLLMIEGGDPDKVGRCAIWNSEIPGCIYQNHVFRVRPYLDSTMDNHFFMQFINSRVTRDYYESCAKRTTNLASINKTQMRSTPIAFPPLEEQKAIVEKVNALMGLCDILENELEQNRQQLADLMQSCLREVFEGKEEDTQLNMAAEPSVKYGN